jgi:hypothetical protein
MLLQPAVAEYGKRLGRIPAALGRAAQNCLREPFGGAWSAAVGSIGKMLPTALFDNRPLERYLHAMF